MTNRRAIGGAAATVAIVVIAVALSSLTSSRYSRAEAAAAAGAPGDRPPDVGQLAREVAALRAEVERLKQVVPDQAHAMSDVAWHYSNVWFAGRAGNWDLAQFMFNETKSHLRWATRIIPVRKDAAGRDVDVKAILDAVEGSALKDLEATIKAKDGPKFEAAYRQMIGSCQSCHQAAGKPYIVIRVPDRAPADILEFAPAAARQ